MSKYKVLMDGVFGEGWNKGDVVELSEPEAEARIKEGHLELADVPPGNKNVPTPGIKARILGRKGKKAE